MKLERKPLRPNTRSGDVARLHDALRRLGFTITDPKGFLGRGTADAVRRFQRENGLAEGDGGVDAATIEAINRSLEAEVRGRGVVLGRITDEHGNGVARLVVRAFAVNVRRDRLLGEATTDALGGYRIRYERSGDVDLQVHVSRSETDERLLLASPVILGALEDETINLSVGEGEYRGPDEFSQVNGMVEAIFEDGFAAEVSDDRTLILLARACGLSTLQVEHYLTARRLEQETEVPAAAFYGLLRTGGSRNPERLFEENGEAQGERLLAAARDNIIAPEFGRRATGVVAELDEAAIGRKLSPARDGSRGLPVGELLDQTFLRSGQRRRFLAAARGNRDPMPEFWTRLRADPAFTSDQIDDVQLVLQLAGTTLNHLPLVRVIRERHAPHDARELASLELDDWLALMEELEPPSAFRAAHPDDPGEARSAYVRAVMAVVAKSFPTARLLSRWNRDPEVGSAVFRRFVRNNPEFEFRETTVSKYLRENGAALEGIDDAQHFTAELQGLHRLFSLVPDDDKFTAVKAMWRENLRSAHAVVRQGAAAFHRRFDTLLGAEHAERVFANARKKTAMSLATLVHYSPLFQGVDPSMIVGYTIDDPPDTIPEWRTLFGSLDFCECRHCRSILSPAAYFVDLLQFLETASLGEQNGLEALLERHRPDLAHIALDCPNTNTAMPYIDLVNEVLENAAVNGVFSLATTPAFQTRAPSDELRANPEHIRPEAYDLLAEQTFPWSLPFNLWHEERRVYLGHLKIETWELMEVFHREGELPSPIDRAATYLGLTGLQREIITGEANSDHGLGTGNQLEPLLRNSRTTLREFEALLRSRFVAPEGVAIEFEPRSCALETATVKLDDGARDRLHRLRRLERTLGWSVFDLDLVIEQIGGGALEAELLIELSFLHRIEQRLRLPVPELVSWWSEHIPSRADEDQKSLYAERFLNPTVANPLTPVTAIFGLSSSEDEEDQLANPQALLEADGTLVGALSPLLTGGLNVTEAALRQLIDRVLPSPQLNLDNLSQLFRVASFSRALGMTATQYLTLVDLTGESGVSSLDLESGDFVATTPARTWEWMALRDRLLAPGFRIEEIEWLILHRESRSFRAPVGDQQSTVMLQGLQGELSKLPPVPDGALQNPVEPSVLDEVQEWLAQKLLLVTPEAEQVMRIVAGTSELTIPEQAVLVAEHLAALFDAESLLAEAAGTDRLRLVYRALIMRLSRTLVVQQLAASLSLEVAVTEALLTRHLDYPDEPQLPAIDVFLAADFLTAAFDTPAAHSHPAGAVIRRLAKLAFVFARFGIRPPDVTPILEQAESRGWLDLRTLPISGADHTSQLGAWLRLSEALALNKRLFKSGFSLFDLFAVVEGEGATRESVIVLLAEQSGWDLESLTFLTGPSGYAFAFPDDFGDERWLLRLEQAFRLIALAGVSGAQIWSWNLREADDGLALRIKAAAKARHTVESWLEVAPPLADRLRRRRRDHLVDFLVANHDEMDEAGDLYGHLLIDPQMEPCFQTSRIKQAISSVQLFVQRVFLGLEPTVRFGDEQRTEWQWRKHYRFRQAALEVLLFPEKYAEPELRDNKSPFFLQLEQDLLQEEVTDASVERAYARYLRSLDEVARLEISGLYVEGSDSGQIVHIFARTHGEPQRYYYRRWIGESYFTPWEVVDVKVEGNHLIPVVYNRRLWLIWPVFEDRAEESVPSSASAKPKKSERFYRIRLSWSQYREGKWTSVKTSQTYIETEAKKDFRHDTKRNYYFWADVKEHALWVHVFHKSVIVSNYYYYIGLDPSKSIADTDRDLNPVQPNQRFSFEGCQEEPRVYRDTSSGGVGWHVREAIPYRTSYSSEARFMKTRQVRTLTMFSKVAVDDMGRIIEDDSRVEVILQAGGNDRFDITPPHQYLRFQSQAPFFVEHRDRAFFVVPHDVADSGSSPGETMFMRKDRLDLGLLDGIASAFEPAAEPAAVAGRHTLVTAASTDTAAVYSSAHSHLVIERRAVEPDSDGDAPAFAVADALPQPASVPVADFDVSVPALKQNYEFMSFYHPYTCLFIEMLNRFGVEGVLAPDRIGKKGRQLHRQLTPDSKFRFSAIYGPTDAVAMLHPYSSPREEIDFDFGGAYSDYNWELFLHIPLLIANRLSQNQRFEEAQRWFHYIFDPTETDDNGLEIDEKYRKFWKIKPFYNASSRDNVEKILNLINQGDPHYEAQIEAWEADPFNPHLVARRRPVAYMKTVVMKYLDNLIAWADRLYQLDTIEAINEAAQLYVLAGRILGRKPVEVKRPEPDPRTYDQVRSSLDALSNSLVNLENILFMPFIKAKLLQAKRIDQGASGKYNALKSSTRVLPIAPPPASTVALLSTAFMLAIPGDEPEPDNPLSLYFCAPKNDKLLGYWDTVADRLFKIRHCMNIEGVERTLALFEPPIEPALLVKAAAAGLDPSSALDDLNAPLPHYRFSYVLPQAIDFCNDVKALGAALLSALEKKDAEALSLLRSSHETQLLKALRGIKENAVTEAKETKASLEAARDTAEFRNTFNRNRQTREEVPGRTGVIAEEVQHEQHLVNAHDLQSLGQGYDLAANIAFLFPDLKIGAQGISSPELTFTYGGTFFGRAYQAFASFYRMLAANESHQAQMASLKAGYRLRAEDWGFQAVTALMEIDQLDRQIAAAGVRVAMAEHDLDNHERQVAQSAEVGEFLRSKFSNEERYGQFIQELSTIHFQAYQAAYDLARRAERCFRFELGVENTNFVQFGYWDNLKKGLLAGELLQKDLRRMQAAYLEQNRREFEISQYFSLDIIDAQALMELRETGTCEFEIPELALDLVYPGHYRRRIRSVDVTFACLTGPYVNVNATLTLLTNRVRMSGDTQGSYAYQGLEDPRFRHNLIPVQSIATSSGNSDSGLLQFDFRDERYLPFEGAGVISRWKLSLPQPEQLRSFDYRSISTVVLRIGYTARSGGDALRGNVETHVIDSLNNWLDELAADGVGLRRLFSLRSDFPSEFHRLLTPADGQTATTELTLDQRHFPDFLKGRQLRLARLQLVLVPREAGSLDTAGLSIGFQDELGTSTTTSGLPAFDWPNRQDPIGEDGEPWRLEVVSGHLDPERVEDVQLLLLYSVS